MVLSDLHFDLRKALKGSSQDKASFSEMWRFYYVESSFSNDDSELLENHFAKWEAFFVPNTS